ncbi:hypothetical protein FDP41_001232 [Naegleria fowleri]|uniref:propanoyl-CoA C-acyltransferase n=1 Tax=Naegleria fowleri TaxID=5763 RepID=A0A6A5C451_NAEFO|nr:uncharacterized protein FDP41_001232 [Naegleria fowleri]KAF0980079.1 hypothetical protein FDP41_001232 [Naegleria fowleri]CAG4716098.1 unnamed protein product [Naegleria fowleri]
MPLPRKVYVLGGYTSKFIGKGHPDFIHKKHPLFGKQTNPDLKWYLMTAIQETLKMHQCKGELVDKIFVGNFAGECFSNQGHLGSGVSEANSGLLYKPSYRLEAACASGGVAFNAAVDSILGGSSDVALVVGAEEQNTVSAREGASHLAKAADFNRQRPIEEFTFPALYAIRKMHYLKKYGHLVRSEDIEAVALKAYAAGNKNPLAQMFSVKLDQQGVLESPKFLTNPEIKEALKMCECSQVSDGGAGLLVLSEEGLQKLGVPKSQAIELLASEVAIGNLYNDTPETFSDLLTTRAAAKRAYEKAGVSPQDISVAEVHDCFAIAEVGMNEALGFSKPGEGAFLHLTKPMVNTGGGLIAFGHPVGATGVKQINEVYKQMKGKAGDYQLKSSLELGVCANMGGNDKTSVVSIFKNL